MATVHSSECGFDERRTGHPVTSFKSDIDREQYDGAVVIVARGPKVGLHEAIGFAERASGRTTQKDDVFCLFSVTKRITETANFSCIDRNELAQQTIPACSPMICGTMPERCAAGTSFPLVSDSASLCEEQTFVPRILAVWPRLELLVGLVRVLPCSKSVQSVM